MKRVTTLCIFHEHPMVLLGMKKRGFGKGRWNGFGGKVNDGESIEAAAARELLEEVGLEAEKFELAGLINFEFKGNPETIEVHVFRGLGRKGEPKESEEMRPRWFDAEKIPFKEMWPDDIYWLPLFLAGKKFHGEFVFGENDTILDMSLREVAEV